MAAAKPSSRCPGCNGPVVQSKIGRSREWCSDRCRFREGRKRRADAAKADATECDCGNPMPAGAESCPSCLWLDGVDAPEMALVSAMRVLGETATIEALAEEMGCTRRTIYRGIASLKKSGRLTTTTENASLEGMPYHKQLRYVPGEGDSKDNPGSRRPRHTGYYVFRESARSPSGGDGVPVIFILKNTPRKAG